MQKRYRNVLTSFSEQAFFFFFFFFLIPDAILFVHSCTMSKSVCLKNWVELACYYKVITIGILCGAVNSWTCSLFLNNLSVSLACLRSDRVTRLVLTNASSYRKHGKTTRIAVFCTVSSLRERYTGRPSWKLGRHIQWLGGCMWDRTVLIH